MEDVETPAEDKTEVEEERTPQEIVEECLAEINHAQEDDDYKNFIAEGEEAYKYYKNKGASFQVSDNQSLGRVVFNPFWSNVEVLQPIYYARLPKIVAKRRFENNDEVGGLACKILERCTDYSLHQEADDFNQVIENAVKDMLIVGRGTGRAFFKADFEDAIDDQGQPFKKVIPFTEKATTGYIFWKDYLTNKSRNASEHRWRAHCSYMTRRELVERFGRLGNFVPLDSESNAKNNSEGLYSKDYVSKAKIWEKWRESDKMAYWIATGFKEQPLDAKPDPLKLQNFYPYPRPLIATTSSDSDIPTGQFKIDKALLKELNNTCKRIVEISQVIRVVGAHDRTIHDDLIKIHSLRDGETTPVNWPQGSTGIFQNGVDWWPFEKAVVALNKLIEYAEWLINKLFQQDGIPDIVRGASNPNETLGAQQIKSNFTIIRTNKKQADVQRFVRDLLAMKAEIIFEFFSDEMIAMMCGAYQLTSEEQALYPQALQLLRDDKMRTFAIDIETDSTIAVDEEAEKKSATDAFTAVNQGLNTAFQVMQVNPHMGITMLQAALYVANRFRGARDWTSSIERAIDAEDKKITDAENAPPPPPPGPSPEEMQMQLDMQKQQAEQAIAEANMSLEQQKAMHKAQLDEAIANHKMAIEQMKASNDIQLKSTKLTAEQLLNEKELALKSTIARIELMQEAMKAAEGDRQRTVEKLKSDKGPTIPNIVINMPSGKKVMRATRDPMTGDLIGTTEDIQ